MLVRINPPKEKQNLNAPVVLARLAFGSLFKLPRVELPGDQKKSKQLPCGSASPPLEAALRFRAALSTVGSSKVTCELP